MMGIALICAALSGQASAPAAVPASPRILVAPFEPPARDGRTYWLGEAVAVLITDDLNARRLGAITRTARERAYDQLHLPANAALSRATVIKVGQLAGASQVIVGDVEVEGDTLTIRARPIRIDIGRTDTEITERGDLKDLFALARRVAERAVPGGTASSTAPTASLQAFEQYIKGLLAEEASSQASFLEAALKIDPAYDRARLALWDVRTAQGDHAAALAAVRGVPATSPFSRRARFRGSVSLIKLKQYDEAFSALTALSTEGDEAAVFNNLGVVQLRRGSTVQSGKPAYFLTKAAKAEPNDPDVLFNLGYSYAIDRDPQAAIYWLREALRRNPADSEAHLVLAFALDSAGSTVEAGRERELAGQLSSRYAESTRHADARSAAARPRANPRGSRVPLRRGRRSGDRQHGAARPGGRSAIPPGPRAPSLRQRAGSRRDGRVAPRRVPVAIRGGRASAHRTHSSARRPAARSRRCVENLDLEPRRGARARRARGSLPAAQGSRQRSPSGAAGARARPLVSGCQASHRAHGSVCGQISESDCSTGTPRRTPTSVDQTPDYKRGSSWCASRG